LYTISCAFEWNSSIYNPIFFDTTGQTLKEIQQADDREKVHEAVRRAIAAALKNRNDLIDQIERISTNHYDARQKQIDDLEKKYQVSRVKREDILNNRS